MEKNLYTFFKEQTEKFHHRKALYFLLQDNLKKISYTYSELNQSVQRGAKLLDRLKLAADDQIAIIAESCPCWITSSLACCKNEIPFVVLDPKLSPERIIKIFNSLRIKGIITNDFNLDHLQSFLPKHSLYWLTLSFYQIDMQLAGTPKQKLIAQDPSEIPSKRSQVLALFYTSGTESLQKGVELTHRNIISSIQDLLKRVIDRRRVGILFPFFHIAGYINTLIPLVGGMELILIEKINPALIRSMFSLKPTIVASVPKLFQTLKQNIYSRFTYKEGFAKKLFLLFLSITRFLSVTFNPPFLQRSLFLPIHQKFGGNWKLIFCGAAFLDKETSDFFHTLGIKIIQGYGATETTGTILVDDNRLSSHFFRGTPLEGLECKVSNPNHEGIGELCFRGKQIFKGYFNLPEATENSLKDGWYFSGDLGKILPDRSIILMGRSREIIVLPNGKKIYPQEVEGFYKNCRGVKELAVFGMKRDCEEEVWAAIVMDDKKGEKPFKKKEILNQIDQISLSLPVDKQIKTIKFVEEIPKTVTFKVQRGKLAQIITDSIAKKEKNQKIEISSSLPFEIPSTVDEATLWIRDKIARIKQININKINENALPIQYGVDSLEWISLSVMMENCGAMPIENSIAKEKSIKEIAEIFFNSLTSPQPETKKNSFDLPANYLATPNQEGLFTAQRELPHSHMEIIAYQVKEKLTKQDFLRSAKQLMEQFPILRTTYRFEGKKFLATVENELEVNFKEEKGDFKNPKILNQRIQKEAVTPINLQNEPPFRALLLSQEGLLPIIILSFHHICYDSVSLSNYLLFFFKSATGRQTPPPDIRSKSDFRFYSEDFRTNISPSIRDKINERTSLLKNRWLTLPTEFRRPSKKVLERHPNFSQTLEQEVVDKASGRAKETGVTFNCFCHTALELLLYGYLRKPSFFITTSFLLREQHRFIRSEGPLYNLVPIPVSLDPELKGSEVLLNNKKAYVSAEQYKSVPWQLLRNKLIKEKGISFHGFYPPFLYNFYHMSNIHNATAEADYHLKAIDVNYPYAMGVNYWFHIKAYEDKATVSLVTSKNLYSEKHCEKFLYDYLEIFKQMCNSLEQPISKYLPKQLPWSVNLEEK